MVRFFSMLIFSTFLLFSKNYIGYASWYGKDFQGKLTASGTRYNMFSYTAAHKYLPLGTIVRVTNLRTKRFVDVKITDRGPYARGRMIDLSYLAAKKIGLVRSGIARVSMKVLYRKPYRHGR